MTSHIIIIDVSVGYYTRETFTCMIVNAVVNCASRKNHRCHCGRKSVLSSWQVCLLHTEMLYRSYKLTCRDLNIIMIITTIVSKSKDIYNAYFAFAARPSLAACPRISFGRSSVPLPQQDCLYTWDKRLQWQLTMTLEGVYGQHRIIS